MRSAPLEAAISCRNPRPRERRCTAKTDARSGHAQIRPHLTSSEDLRDKFEGVIGLPIIPALLPFWQFDS